MKQAKILTKAEYRRVMHVNNPHLILHRVREPPTVSGGVKVMFLHYSSNLLIKF